jgi:hypothetical protein
MFNFLVTGTGPNTVPVPAPESPNEYGSDRFRFRLRNPGTYVKICFFLLAETFPGFSHF